MEVWWEADGVYYRGTVRSYNPRTRKHVILYDDNEEERVNLQACSPYTTPCLFPSLVWLIARTVITPRILAVLRSLLADWPKSNIQTISHPFHVAMPHPYVAETHSGHAFPRSYCISSYFLSVLLQHTKARDGLPPSIDKHFLQAVSWALG